MVGKGNDVYTIEAREGMHQPQASEDSNFANWEAIENLQTSDCRDDGAVRACRFALLCQSAHQDIQAAKIARVKPV